MVLILYSVLLHLPAVALAGQTLALLLKLARQVDQEAVLAVTVLSLAALVRLGRVATAVAVLEAT
jgi:fatty acid-binding protein DegV